MSNQSDHQQVYLVRSLEEVKRILVSAEKYEFKTFFLKVFVCVWVLAANTLLKFLQFVLFKNKDLSGKEFYNIVVYTVGILGDNAVMLPALVAIKRSYPKARLTLITNCQKWNPQPALELLKPLPYIDHLVIVKDYDCPVQRHGMRFSIDVPEVNGISCDLFVNLSPFGNRGWLGAVIREMLLGRFLRAECAYGFHMSTYARRNIFNSVQHRFVKNEPRRASEVLRELGISPVEGEDLFPHDITAKKSLFKKIKKYSDNSDPFFIINPGAKFNVKCWPVERFASIARWFSDLNEETVVLTGIADEKKVADDIIKLSTSMAVNLAGETTIQELIELLRMAKVCVTNDTGTLHLAAIIGTPTVAIFTTRHSPAHWLPFGHNIISIFTLLNCSYCYNDFCENPDCLNAIGVGHVIQAIKRIMEAA